MKSFVYISNFRIYTVVFLTLQSLCQWLARCMFSPVATIRTATCRLLVMLCFEISIDGEAQMGSPVDIALVLQK